MASSARCVTAIVQRPHIATGGGLLRLAYQRLRHLLHLPLRLLL